MRKLLLCLRLLALPAFLIATAHFTGVANAKAPVINPMDSSIKIIRSWIDFAESGTKIHAWIELTGYPEEWEGTVELDYYFDYTSSWYTLEDLEVVCDEDGYALIKYSEAFTPTENPTSLRAQTGIPPFSGPPEIHSILDCYYWDVTSTLSTEIVPSSPDPGALSYHTLPDGPDVFNAVFLAKGEASATFKWRIRFGETVVASDWDTFNSGGQCTVTATPWQFETYHADDYTYSYEIQWIDLEWDEDPAQSIQSNTFTHAQQGGGG